jgi:uncharacterized DUF497 family protein
MITWDADKRKRNIRKHRGVDLSLAERFDFVTAVIENDWESVGEQRFRAIGWIDDRLYLLVYTLRGDDTHVVSLRLATRSEYRRYEQSI